MGVMDRYNERKKKKSENSTGGKSASGGVKERYEQNKYYETLDLGSVNEEYVSTFVKDAGNFFTTVGGDGSQLGFDSINSTIGDLDTRYNTIKGWLYKNGDGLDEKSYSDFSATLDSLKSNLDSVKDYYSKWDSEEAYTAAMEQLAADTKRWEALSGGYDPEKNKQEGLAGWNEYLQTQERIAQNQAQEESDEQWYEKLLGYLGDVGQDTSLPVHATQEVAQGYRDQEAAMQKPSEGWTEEQQQTYGYLWKNSRSKAAEYAQAVNSMLSRQKEQEQLQQIQKWVTDSFGGGAANTVGAVLAAPFGLADFMGDTIAQGTLGYIPESDGQVSPFEYSQAVTGGVSQKLNEDYGTLDENIPIIGGKGLGDVYGLGTSIAQSSLAAMTGGSVGTLVQFFGSAAASGVDDALSRGADGDQAVIYGTMQGLAEGLAETVGVDNLMKIGSSGTVRQLVGNILKQGAAEGIEEGITSVLNNFADNLVLGDKSNFYALVEQYMAQGMSEGDAKKQAWKDSAEGIAFDMLGGFVSGGIHAAPQTAYQTYRGNKQAQQLYGDDPGALVGEALEIDPENAFAQKMQGRLEGGKKLSGGQLNRLVQQNEAAMTAQDMQAIQTAAAQRLRDLGEGGDVNTVAQALAKQAAGEKLTRSEKQAISGSKYGARVANELNTDNIRSGDHSSAWAEKIGTNRINAREYGLMLQAAEAAQEGAEAAGGTDVTQVQNEAQRGRVAVESGTKDQEIATTPEGPRNDSSVGDGVTRQVSTGKEVTPKKIVSIEGGKVMIQTDSGAVAADDIEFGDNDTDLLWRNAVTFNGITTAGANGIIHAYRSGQPAPTYLHGAAQEFRNGYYNLPSGGEAADKLTPAQRTIIYELGQKAAGENIAKAHSVAKKNGTRTVEDAGPYTQSGGKVHFDRKGRTFDQKRETALKTMEQLSKALGVEFYVFESYKNEAGQLVYKDGAGNEVHAPNGYYDPKDGSIHIDLNAGADGKGTMLFTVAHELTHFIKEWSPAKFKVLANFLVEQYGEKGVSVEELVQWRIAKAAKNGRTLDYDTAFEEVVADSMEAILTDGNVQQMMAELKQRDKTLWQKICDWFKDLVADLKALAEAYKGYEPDSAEGRMVAQMQDVTVILESLYTDALVDAGENYRAGKTQKNTTREGDVKMSVRTVAGDAVVWIEENILKDNHGQPTHQFIANYIAEHIGEVYTIIESGQKVYIGEDLPGEYTQSKYTKALLRNNPNIVKAKNRASANLGDMIEIATNRRWEKTKHPGSKDAKYGIYRYDTRFGFPVKSNSGDVTGANIYSAELLIRNASDGKKYLYDIVSIKKDIASSDWLTQRVTSAAGKPAGQKGDVSKNNIAQNADEVKEKFSMRDSDGNVLTQEQQEYFKDSKVRDEQGRLLAMYHGTPNGGFTKFRSGTYFTQNPGYADVYQNPGASSISSKRSAEAPMTYKVYLNIQKPFDTRNAKERRIFQQEFYRQYGTGTPLADSGLPDWVDGMDLQEFIEEMEYDYDGLILDEGGVGGYGDEVVSRGLSYVVFDPAQVKNVDNKTPTNDPDIRYSDRDSEGNQLSEEQSAFFAQSKARDKDGKLLVLYHGTANAGFTAFDPGKGRLGGSWFTTSRADADSYAGNYQHRLFDPNETDEIRSGVGGSYTLGSWMRFDSEADRAEFLKQYPGAESVKTDAEYAQLMQQADEAGNFDEYERLEEEQIRSRSELKKIQKAYGRYEWEHSREATLQELFDHPERFSMSDVLRAWDAYDSNHAASENDATKEELIVALREADRESMEQGDDTVADIRFKARLAAGQTGEIVNRANNRTYAVYANATRPYEIDAGGRTLHEADLYPAIEAGLKDRGFDSVIVRSAKVGAHGENGDVVIIKEAGQVKLTSNKAPTEGADIHLSERDPELERVNRILAKENTELKYDIAYLKELLKLQKQVTGGTKFTKTSVEAAAGQLMKYANARGDKAELAGLLNGLYEYIARGEELTWDGVTEAAQPAVQWLQSHVRTVKQADGYARDILREIRGSRVSLDELQKKEVAYQYGSYNDFRKSAMGSITITDRDAISLDSQWHEWASLYPNIFDPETTSNDMPAALMDAIDSLRRMTETDAYGYDRELFGQELLRQVYDSYWNVSTLYTVKDKAQKEINRLKFDHTGRMAALRKYHREKTEQLKAEHREALQKVKQAERERFDKKLQETGERYQQSREKNAENRRKAEMRKKIRRTVMDLGKILNRGDKKRNVKEDMKDLVSQALKTADILFTDNYTGEDMVRSGVDTDLTEQESRYLQEAREILARIEGGEPAANLQGKLDYRMGKLRDVFARERTRLNKTTVSKVLGDLADAYKSLEGSEYDYVKGAFDENVHAFLTMLKADVGGTTVKDMSLHQLDELHKAYTMVLTTVRNANKMFAANMKQTREQLGNRVIGEVIQAGGEHGLWLPGEDKISAFSWNNQKPVYAFQRIGSDTLTQLFENTRAGEDSWAQDMTQAREYYLSQTKKHKYDSWDFEKQYPFTSTSGIDFSLNLEQIMSLYAYSKREQAHEHLLKGGFVFDGSTEVQVNKNGIKVTYLNKTAKAHNISPEIMGQIVGKLTTAQRAFVDEMQDYLSTTMGAKGNEVSMQMYGVELFKEKNYFPLRSAGQYMERAKEADLKKQQGQISIVNSGFTKATTPKSSNPVVLSGFMDVWASHVNEMSMYHSFVLPMEDFRRVYNYSSPNMETGRSVSVNSVIQDAYGEAATGYIDQLYRDLNGGAVADPRETPGKALMGKFKKAAVFASLSVVVQQPSAISRAFAVIDPKYFIGSKVDSKRHKALWAQLKQYAPVAVIKEMGYFDTGMGRSAQEFIKGKEYGTLKEKAAALFTDENYRDEVLSKGPALADELTWCTIWEAAKRETKARNPRMDAKSEAFLQLAGQRFTEVITKTQVYDSVLSRSANMRSKGAFMSMWTAFMAEPTTTVNMVEDALRRGKRGDKQYAARAMGAVLGSIVLNALLSSLVYAIRDDDEDETFLEKYVQSFAAEILDGINPLTYYPLLKDIWSVMQGFDIERADMSLITSLVEAITKLVQVYSRDTDGMDGEELEAYDKQIADAWWGVVDYVTALAGVPVKNVRREITAAMNSFQTVAEDLAGRETTWGSLLDKTWESVKNAIPVVGWLPDKTAADKLYKATVSGDTAYRKRLESAYSSQTALDNTIRKGLRANDARIWEAAMAWNSNDLESYMRIAREIIAEGNFSQDNVVMAIQAEAKAMVDTQSSGGTESKAKGYFTAEKFAVAVSQGNGAMAAAIKADIIDTAMANGKTAEAAEESFKTSAKSSIKALFLEGGITEAGARNAMADHLGISEEDAAEDVQYWAFQKAYPEYDLSEGAVTKYYAFAEPAGIGAEVYYDYYTQASGLTGDKDENGNTISGSYKAKVMAVIHAMDLTGAQKDALYYANGWAESTIDEAPWR